MDKYIVKEWGHSLHVILNKNKHKPGDEICVTSEDDLISLNLLITDMFQVKTDIKYLKSKYGE